MWTMTIIRPISKYDLEDIAKYGIGHYESFKFIDPNEKVPRFMGGRVWR